MVDAKKALAWWKVCEDHAKNCTDETCDWWYGFNRFKRTYKETMDDAEFIQLQKDLEKAMDELDRLQTLYIKQTGKKYVSRR